MSVTFSIKGYRHVVEDPTTYVNLSNVNARHLLLSLGLLEDDSDLWGEMRAPEFAARCKTSKESLEKYGDKGMTPYSEGRYHFCGRSPGLLVRRLGELLDLCEKAGDLGVICWG